MSGGLPSGSYLPDLFHMYTGDVPLQNPYAVAYGPQAAGDTGNDFPDDLADLYCTNNLPWNVPFQPAVPPYFYDAVGNAGHAGLFPEAGGYEMVPQSRGKHVEATETTSSEEKQAEIVERPAPEQISDDVPAVPRRPTAVGQISIEIANEITILDKDKKPHIIISPPIHIPTMNSPLFMELVQYGCEKYKEQSKCKAEEPTNKRPMNSFLLFSCRRREEIRVANAWHKIKTGHVSSLLAAEWNFMKAEGHAKHYHEIAACIKEEFEKDFPHYEYTRVPSKSKASQKMARSSSTDRVAASKKNKRSRVPYSR